MIKYFLFREKLCSIHRIYTEYIIFFFSFALNQ